jgi:dienelactone hydrolase
MIYAVTCMVVFLSDYFTETCGDINLTTLSIALRSTQELQDNAYAQRIALSAYTALKRQPIANPAKIGAMGFCFGGAIAL